MTVAKRQNRTLIDTLSAGYSALNRRLWVLLIPIIANLYLAFGPQVSLAPLVQELRAVFATLPQAEPTVRADLNTALQQLAKSDMRQPLLWLNYVPLLTRSAGEALPAINPQRADTLVVRGPVELLALFGALNAAFLALSGAYLLQLALAVGDSAHGKRHWLLASLWLVGALALWNLLVAAVAMVLSLPYFIAGTLLGLVVPPALPVMVALFGFIAFWVSIYIGFSAEAMALDRVGPLRAISRSFRLVRRNFLATVGLLLLIWLIGVGLGLVWQQLSVAATGVVIACVASAYISSGLAAARLVYYRERSVALPQAASSVAGKQ